MSPAAHVSTAAWGLAIAWRVAALPWLATVLILAAGEAVAQAAPAVGAPPVARFIAVTIGLRTRVPTDGGARLAAVVLWAVAAWALLNAIARLIDGLRTLGAPAFTAPVTWVIAPTPGLPVGVPRVPVPPPSARPTTGPAMPTGAPAPAPVQPRPFALACAGLTIMEPRAGWPPRPVSPDAPSWPAYRQACRAWYADLQREVTRAHLERLPTEGALEARLGRAPSPTGREEEALWTTLARADIPCEPAPQSPLAKLCLRNYTRDATASTAYYVPDAATRDPATFLLIDIEVDGSDHRGRLEADAQRDRFFRDSGWYVARLDLDASTGLDRDRRLPSDLSRLIDIHHQACRVAQAAL